MTECTLGLMAEPAPGELDRDGADMDVAGLADAEVAREAAAGLARVGETGQGPGPAAIAKAVRVFRILRR